MPVFGIEADISPDTRRFMSDTNERLQSSDIVKNPFTGKISLIKGSWHQNKDTYAIYMNPVYPPIVPFVGLFYTLVIVFIFGLRSGWLIAPGAILVGSFLFWSTPFYYVMLRIGLRKHKAIGNKRLISKSEVIRRFLYSRRDK